MLRVIGFLFLLIISRLCYSETIPAVSVEKFYVGVNSKTQTLSSSVPEACSKYLSLVGGDSIAWCDLNGIGYYKKDSSGDLVRLVDSVYRLNVYSCSSGYFLSDSAGNADSSGHYCTKPNEPVDKTCAELAADGSYELGSGFFVAGHDSTYCYQANPTHICQITNYGESIYFGKVSDTCSIGMGGGSYWSYTGSDCTSVGPSVNYYKTSQAASLACNPTLPDGTSSAVPTVPDTSDSDSPPPCPGGSGSITNGTETMTVCLDTPVSPPSSSTPTTDNSSSGSNSPSTDNSTTNNDNSTTNNNTTNTSNSSSSTTNNTTTTNNDNSTTNNDNSTTTNNDNSTTNTSGGSSGSSSGSSSGTGGDGSATSGASGTGGSGTATSGASGTGGNGDSVSGADSTCPDGDDSLACATLGSAPESEALKPTDVNFGYTPDAAWWGGSGSGSGGSCVADYKVSSDISVSYEPLCKTLTSVRPVLLGVCFLISATILFGFRRNGGDD